MRIHIGSDHAGFELKEKVKIYLCDKGYDVIDEGPCNGDRVDYPVYGAKVGRAVIADEGSKGIVICGSGIGISIAANKIDGIRAALCGDTLAARLSREHNNANVLAMGARLIGETMAMEIADVFLQTDFAGGRHAARVELISDIERNR